MIRFGIKKLGFFLLLIFVFSLVMSTSVGAICDAEDCLLYASSEGEFANLSSTVSKKDDIRVSSRLYELLFGKDKDRHEDIYLIPGGDVFGIRIKEANVTVSSANDGSALKRGDKIISVNGYAVSEPCDVSAALSDCGGGAVKIEIMRSGEKMTLTVIPIYEDGSYKLGVTLRKLACGIGTITFIDPKTNLFGGLGHGVCEAENGKLIEIDTGELTGVILGSIKKGEIGKPGELSGVLNQKRLGTIDINSECGVFGVLDECNTDASKPLPIGEKEELKLGAAEIISTVKNGKKAKYSIEITDIDVNSSGSKSFKIKVTDPMLITLTGGIVRGMSGSPIIQNGKLVGAVTHVLVANPTEGYGIFIENMLNASQSQATPKAA